MADPLDVSGCCQRDTRTVRSRLASSSRIKYQLTDYTFCYYTSKRYPSTMSEHDVRTEILAAAEQQLRRVGRDRFRVTELARDLGMSHGNIYRYFSSRGRLIEALAEVWYEQAQQELLATAELPGSAAERLERFVVEFLTLKRAQVEDIHVRRVLEAIIEEAPHMPEQRLDVIRSCVASIIEDGIGAGEFRSTDAVAVAWAFVDATAAFYRPSLVAIAPLEVLEPRARAVVALLIGGLR
jgi:AcrR family transcriptional regulator